MTTSIKKSAQVETQKVFESLVTRKLRDKNWRYEITEENSTNINPAPFVLWKGKNVLKYATPKNPFYDSAQIIFERKENAKSVSDFSKTFVAFGWCIYRKRITRNKLGKDISYLKNEIAETATSAAINFVATSAAPLEMFERLKKEELKNWPKEIYANAFREVDSLLFKMAKTAQVPLSYFEFLDAEFSAPEIGSVILPASTEEKKRFADARCEQLKKQIAENAPDKVSKRKSAIVSRAIGFIERAREYAHAAIDSENFALVAPKLFLAENETRENKITVRAKNTGRIVRIETEKQVIQKENRLKRNADARRNRRFEKIIGVQLSPINPGKRYAVDKVFEKKGFLEKIIGMTKAEIAACKKSGAIKTAQAPFQKTSGAVWQREPIKVWTAQLIGAVPAC